jgi:hypothetical protein
MNDVDDRKTKKAKTGIVSSPIVSGILRACNRGREFRNDAGDGQV